MAGGRVELAVVRRLTPPRLVVRATTPKGTTEPIVIEGDDAARTTIDLDESDPLGATATTTGWDATNVGLRGDDDPIDGPPVTKTIRALTWNDVAGVLEVKVQSSCTNDEYDCFGPNELDEPPPDEESQYYRPCLGVTSPRDKCVRGAVRAARSWLVALANRKVAALGDKPFAIALNVSSGTHDHVPPACAARFEKATLSPERLDDLARCVAPLMRDVATASAWQLPSVTNRDDEVRFAHLAQEDEWIFVELSGPDTDCSGSAAVLALDESDGWRVAAVKLSLPAGECEDH